MPRKEKLLNSRDESFYDWNSSLDGLKEKLKNDETNTILVSAPFGCGKSSFTNILINELKDEEKDSNIKWDINIIETWKYELLDSDSVVTQLIFDIINNYLSKIILYKLKIDKGVKVESYSALKKYDLINVDIIKKHGKNLLKSVLKKYTKLDYDKLIEIHKTALAKKLDEVGDSLKDNYISALEFYEEFVDAFLIDYNNSPKYKNSKIIFVFRDCDRCNPENLLKIIDAIHHLDVNDKIKFIVESDIDSIKAVLCMKYHLGDYPKINEYYSLKGELINGYLNKIFETICIIDKKYLNKQRLLIYLNYQMKFEHKDYELLTFDDFTYDYKQNYRYVKYHFEKVLPNRLNKINNLNALNLIEINTLLYLYLLNEENNGNLIDVHLPKLSLKEEKRNLIWLSYSTNNDNKWGFANKINMLVDGAIIKYANSIYLIINEKKCKVIKFPENFFTDNSISLRTKMELLNQVIENINTSWKEMNLINS